MGGIGCRDPAYDLPGVGLGPDRIGADQPGFGGCKIFWRQRVRRVLQQPPQRRFLLAERFERQLVGFVFALPLNLPDQRPKYGLAGNLIVVVTQRLYELRPGAADNRVLMARVQLVEQRHQKKYPK